MCRQLEAFRKYLKDKEGRDLLAAECRRTEVLIGELAPAEQTWTGKPSTSPMGEVVKEIPKDDLYKFRLMAAHKDVVEELLAHGKVSRNVILEKIQRLNTLPTCGMAKGRKR
jgi:hypothetical protein